MNTHPTKILYIAGRGNSGSTLVDIVCSAIFEYRSCGEIVSGLRRSDSTICTCGELMNSCSEWNNDNSISIDKKNKTVTSILSRSEGSITKRVGNLFDSLFRREKHKPDLESELQFLTALVRGKSGIVDSSKELARAFFLIYGPANSNIIHLVRNPMSLMQSARNRVSGDRPVVINSKTYRVPTHLLYLLDFFVCCAFTFTTIALHLGCIRKRSNYCIMEYEEFVSSTPQTLDALARKFNIQVKANLSTFNGSFPVEHLVGGNRMARTQTVSINPTAHSNSTVPTLSKFICLIFAGLPYALIRQSRHNLKNQSNNANGTTI